MQTCSIIKIVRLFGARFEHNKSDKQGNKRGHATALIRTEMDQFTRSMKRLLLVVK